jgi:Helix-turn-helix domain
MVRLKELEKWMSTGQVAERLGWTRQGVLNLAEQKRVRAVRTACGWLYDPKSIEEFAQKERATAGMKRSRGNTFDPPGRL